MYCMHKNVGNFRSKRKCTTLSGRWLFMLGILVLLLSCVSGRPADEEFDGFPDVDNIEWHHVKIVDGVVQPEDHPVIFYKEDFVSEDYDPAKERRKNAADGVTAHRTRTYKDISRHHRTDTEQYRALKPEKMYFDVLPQAPVVVEDDSSANDSKFDASKIRVELLSLADDTNEQEVEDEASKQILSKRPKKYRRRQRRDTSANEHRREKRSPNYSQSELIGALQTIIIPGYQPQKRQPVKATYYHNAYSGPVKTAVSIQPKFGPENETDRVNWGASTLNRIPTKRPQPPLFHDVNNSDTSFLNTNRRPAQPSAGRTQPQIFQNSNSGNWIISSQTTTIRPPQLTTPRTQPPLFHDSNPDNWDTSFLKQQNSFGGSSASSSVAVPPPVASAQQSAPISNCVWAIVNCCSGQNNMVRNACFERMMCGQNFWGLNPCASEIQERALKSVDNFFG